MPDLHVELRDVSKLFGATKAVDDLSISIDRGSVHALVGENGAGKSTVGKIIAGVHRPDAGSILVNGKQVLFRSPRDALAQGITMVAQELSLVPARSVRDNVFLGDEPSRAGIVRTREQRRRFASIIERVGFDVPLDALVMDLAVAEQQKVEILRALGRNADLIIMDEPTARLSTDEAQTLLSIVARLSREGTTVILVSHFLDQVLDVADAVSVLRDGALVSSKPASQETERTLVEAMIGRSLDTNFGPKLVPPPDAPIVLDVRGLRCGGTGPTVDLTVRAGEIVGLAGLVGSGRSEIARAIYGADRRAQGEVTVCGKPVKRRSTRGSIRAGMGLIPESRKDQGLLLGRSIRDNVALPHLDVLSRLGWIRRRPENQAVTTATKTVDVRSSSIEQAVTELSGGNQQKSLFARWFLNSRSVLIADEPTRGVDVGAKRTIYDLITDAASAGLAVLFVSSELDEVMGLAHRVLVVRDQQIVLELASDGINETRILAAAFATTAGETR
ncbi:sugar ABC transporter ATP-binding protein [Candidatus Poriferisodalis sp.]|uniref:sugar ABC transporter ATP-binding protein n=1 Tax=Candidatus Poriferisodalis sp. TaxID=3101277 RepID=UPI003B02A04D